MRLVAVADTHLFHAELRVPEGDVFIHAGDLCRGGTLDELKRAAEWIHSLPHRTKVVVAGNHDWSFSRTPAEARAVLGESERVIYLQDCGVELEGVKLWGSPWQPEFNDWAFNLPRGAALAEKWALIPSGIDLLITHSPPQGIGDGDGKGYGGAGRLGCADLTARVTELAPALHLFGHIHDAGGLWTIGKTVYANVTTWECERQPTVIDFDPATKTVTPIEVPPARLR
jgi:Icc-related predicted phosphoesterase